MGGITSRELERFFRNLALGLNGKHGAGNAFLTQLPAGM